MSRRSLFLLALLAAAALPIAGRAARALEVAPSPGYVMEAAPRPRQRELATAVFAGGCFWGVEAVFEHVRGVTDVVSGFAREGAGGEGSASRAEPAEAVRVTYDPSQVTYAELLRVFFLAAHDPTQLDRQGPDVGAEYRSAIFYADEEQRSAAAAYVAQLERSKSFAAPIVTRLVPLGPFKVAAPYHQDYAAHHPNDLYVVVNDRPKVERLRREFPTLYRDWKAEKD